MTKQLENIKHDYIRYANCWEDADLLLDSLDIKPTDKILSIASAGDNSFSLLTKNPKLVLAVDINAVQLHLVELKKVAIVHFTYDDFLNFLGFTTCETRWQMFLSIESKLPTSARLYWNEQQELINAGIIHQGKFEKYFQFFHTKILPFIHSKKTIAELFETKSDKEQQIFFTKKWNNWRWNMLFKVFFSKYVLGKYGRDPEFLKEVQVPVSTFILNKAKKHLSHCACQNNYFLRYILTGKFDTQLPHYARKENFEKIKLNLDRLKTFHGLPQEAFVHYGKFNTFNLSNIFEYMSPTLFNEVSSNLIENSLENAHYAYWNLMVPRQMSTLLENVKNQINTAEVDTLDMGFFYNNFVLDVKK
ncbi:MAG: DUF3419 family protein [Flavobacteriales bacterium]|nr:DUF3419 family protein [Flavobacteriales bacterium]